jgi:regulator of protease activity HflC (stomatin/prohibitin superfamily)
MTPRQTTNKENNMFKLTTKTVIASIASIALLGIVGIHGCMSINTVQPGQVGVVSLFGKVSSDVLPEGIHFTNPYAKVTPFDARQKTKKEAMGVPSQDQLTTTVEISIQYRLIKEKAANMLKETGSPDQVIDVHMIPRLRSKLREIGKSVQNAEDFYLQKTQARMQAELLAELTELSSHGIKVTQLLIRNVKLPKIITDAVARKKQAAQDAEKAKEDLKKFTVEQDKKKAQANAEKEAAIVAAKKEAEVRVTLAQGKLDAAMIEAKAVVVEAEAEKKAKQLIVEAVGVDNYVRLEALKALPAFQDGNHVIIMDPSKTSPLPFMNIGAPSKPIALPPSK